MNSRLAFEPLLADHPGMGSGLLDGHVQVEFTEEGRRLADELAARLDRNQEPER
ncbi:hypothetical protein [Micromonospora sp. CA-111912]|uniref:hypothetical protein n=1 Tax=Micromonospora sp. CA-111912 TaxID=3239955 RepID=UPI003D8CD8E0